MSNQSPAIVVTSEEELKSLLGLDKSELILEIIRLRQELKKYQNVLGIESSVEHQSTIAFVKNQSKKLN
jgi:hypothetical protein